MKRVAFIINIDSMQWNGGLNYYRNLIRAICDFSSNDISPVIITGLKADKSVFKDYPDVEYIKTGILDRNTPGWFMQRSVDRIFSRDILLEPLLSKNQIDLLSHSQYALNPRSSLPMCTWIPDFQQIDNPNFFSKKEIKWRDKEFHRLCMRSSRIILSSYDAQRDLTKFAPELVSKSRVLQFVTYPQIETSKIDVIKRKYHFDGPFFLLPNQFWIHKNHRIVFEALRILRARNQKVLIIATGKQYDYRNPNYYNEMIKLARDYDILDSFRPLGVIPYSDLTCLMNYSVAMINPSFFEGWSTSVEEAKSLGKQIILSDILVHREQDPSYATYFDPNNEEELAAILWQTLSSWDSKIDRIRKQQAKDQFPSRWHNFGKTYNNIINDALE